MADRSVGETMERLRQCLALASARHYVGGGRLLGEGSIGEARNAVEDGIFLERERRNHELNSKLVFPSFCRGLLSRVR